MSKRETNKAHRRQFLGSLAAGATAFGISVLPGISSEASIPDGNPMEGADSWFEKVKGKHRVVFDVPAPHSLFPFAWPRNFLLTNQKTGTPEADCGVVVVLRHEAICYALDSSLWEKYKFGEVFKVADGKTQAPAIRNPFWKPAPGEFSVPGIGPLKIGINELQESGVMFCVCATAITIHAAILAGGKDSKAIEQELTNAVLPGIQLVPSGLWALGRAQEKKCAYIFVG